MLRKLFIFCVLMACGSSAFAASEPTQVSVTPTAGTTVANTDSVTLGPFPWPHPGVDGAGSINFVCASAGGTADVQVEILGKSAITASTPVACYQGATNMSVLTASSNTDYGEAEAIVAVPFCAFPGGVYVKFTGVGSNPADSVCKAVLSFK